jgi:hypothetical protein
MHEAPRLENHWANLEGHLLRMMREQWSGFSFPMGEYVRIDLADTPLASLSRKVEFIGAAGRRISSSEVEVLAFRRDPKDLPTDINVYRYLVMESFPAVLDLGQFVQSADTDFDANLEGYLTEHVFITLTYLPPE